METKTNLKNFTWEEFDTELNKLFVFDDVTEEPALFGISLPYDFLTDLGPYSTLSEYLQEEVGFCAQTIDEQFEQYNSLYLAVIGYVEKAYFTFGKRQFQDADMASDTFTLSVENGKIVEKTRHFVTDLDRALKNIDPELCVMEFLPRVSNFRYTIVKGDIILKALTLGDMISLDFEKLSEMVAFYMPTTC